MQTAGLRFDSKAPSLMVRKAGFRSVLLPTRGAAGVRITLQTLTSKPFLHCTDTKGLVSIGGGGESFWFPKTEGVEVSPEGHDVDYVMRVYSVKTDKGPRG